uniref:Uncharacterized protein n=1 Tax=Acrobeloides nanus TaxID=290746 RepID=A0A914CZM0_9BILA
MFVRVVSSPSGSKVYNSTPGPSRSFKRRSMDHSNNQRLSLVQADTNGEQRKTDDIHLTIPEGALTKAESTSSLLKTKKRLKKIRHNTCVGAVFLLILGVLFNGLAYFASVWSAQLNAEVIEAAVAKHQSLHFRLKKVVAEGPSKYLIGLLSFAGRVFSAIGTLMLAQALITWCQKRRSRYLRGAAGHADGAVDEIHGGCAEVVGDCFTHCLSFA